MEVSVYMCVPSVALIELFNYDKRIKTAAARAVEDNKISFESLERCNRRRCGKYDVSPHAPFHLFRL